MNMENLNNWNFNWINGEKLQAPESLDVHNPGTGEIIGRIPDLDEESVVKAIAAADEAFPPWSKLPAKERSHFLEAWAEKLLQDKEKLAMLLSMEQGKPFREALGEIMGTADIIRWYAEEGKRAYGEIIPASNSGQQLLVFREPVGVVGLITPMNFPAATVARKVAPALAAGCTLVLKPAEATPLVAIALFRHLMDTGIPGGVANLVTGNALRIGSLLISDHRVRKISFTGSTKVGKLLMEQAAQTVKRVSLELGGNSPAIVFPDADLDKAAKDIAANKFENCGQVCNGINLIYVHNEVHDAFIAKFLPLVQKLKVGLGSEPGTDIGPLINRRALEKVERLVQDAKAKGAKVLVGGSAPIASIHLNGHFYAPTVLDQVDRDMDITREEIFGPLAPILTFTNEEEVLKKANDTPYGLAAYVFTQDFARIHRMMQGLATGNIGINGTSLAYSQAPFGGIKESGIGREGGKHGLDEFMSLKYVAMTIV